MTDLQQALNHLSRWGSDAYTVRKVGKHWVCEPFFGMAVSPTVYKTKREATAQFERFYDMLLDRHAGRV